MMTFKPLRSEFLYEAAPFPSCHASTLAETPAGIVAAYFGGTHERNPDVCVWVSRLIDKSRWSDPIEAANGIQADGSRLPCWNPVLFAATNGPLMLFYKVGPTPATWWGMLTTSDDNGQTWNTPVRLPDGILGPIKNKPVQLPNGHILSPTSTESPEHGWRVYFERSEDNGKTWTATPLVENPLGMRAIQPSILIHSPTRLQALGRTKSKQLFETWSEDAGRTWTPLALLDVPNPNSGTDAVTLEDGRHLLVYNNSAENRYPLSVGLSADGVNWTEIATLDQAPVGQYSYPSVIQASDGLVHISYTWKRLRIKYVVLDPKRVELYPKSRGRQTAKA